MSERNTILKNLGNHHAQQNIPQTKSNNFVKAVRQALLWASNGVHKWAQP